jgi:hypothetical protein
MAFKDFPDEDVMFSLEQLRGRVRTDIPPVDQIPPGGGFQFRYVNGEWRIPASELRPFVDYLMNLGLVDDSALARLRDRRAGSNPADVSRDRRTQSDRRQSTNPSAPRRRMSDFLDM